MQTHALLDPSIQTRLNLSTLLWLPSFLLAFEDVMRPTHYSHIARGLKESMDNRDTIYIQEQDLHFVSI